MYFQVAIIIFLASEISGKFEIFPRVQNFIQFGENEICKIQSDIYRKNLRNYTIWAHKMLDSTTKGTFGVLPGNEYQFGNYEECLNSNGPFSTQYCLVGVTINVPSRNSTKHSLNIQDNQYGTVFTNLKHNKIKNVKLGMCFPSSCSASDIQASLTKSLKTRENTFETVGITYTVTSSEEFCSDYVNPKRFGVLEITLCVLFFTMLILALIGTIGDWSGRTEENPNKVCFVCNKLCSSFSIRRNWNDLFEVHGKQEETKIFNGIKCISAIIIFFAHFAGTALFMPLIKGVIIDDMIYNSTLRLLVEKIDLIVDIFFVMSGLLLVHGILKKWKTVYINPIWLIFHRYIRLTPLSLYVSLYFVTMLPYFASGPIWSPMYMIYFKRCVQNNNWWLNILYINNFMTDSTEACNEVNWYISCDFQLFIVGVWLMFIVKKNLRIGSAILGLFFILSIITTFAITRIYEIVPSMDTLESEQFKLFLTSYYVKPYTRAPCYILGMFGGILYNKLKSQKVKISKVNSYAITGISLLLMGVSYLYSAFTYHGQENYMFEFALYNALHRPIWGMGVLGICIVVSFGSFPALRLFLSSSFWTPFAKLTYGFYLIHEIVLSSTLVTSPTGIRMDLLNMTSLFFALVGFTVIISLCLYVIVEAPFAQIFKVIMLRKYYEKPLSIGKAAVEEERPITEIKDKESEREDFIEHPSDNKN